MEEFSIDKSELKVVINDLKDACSRIEASLNGKKIQLEIGNSNCTAIIAYQDTIAKLREVLTSYYQLLEKDYKNLENVKRTMELIDLNMAEDIIQ